ncbi:hypothetical protein BU25DRAFT_331219 [Macroventuria anomochaeta]|uniref:Uncharacterized protein n=1 Tax=Macroventuria anomochaeta TaxID=301207 RepID=A0ACB6SCW5_9PLEO|nr:uncharacterized protein BU25DRAFT_331219 [Macroventuria anomochaeta]KAF2631879.1 hypothetical protein BU25DRAFT_331219 [Macroventuria anomochaeta]
MVLALALKAELNGVTDLRPLDTEDSPFYYTFKVQCTSCRETHPNWVSVSRFEQNEISGSKGEANFVWKCKNCKVFLTVLLGVNMMLMSLQREHSANIKAAPAAYERNDPPKTKNILEFDCRGLEFVEFKADESGTKFENIELHEGEWFDYDEKASEEVSITNLVWEVRRA